MLESTVATQNFENKGSNILDKPLYILLQFLLPRAFDASTGISRSRMMFLAMVRCRSKFSVKQCCNHTFCESPFKGRGRGIVLVRTASQSSILCWELVSKRGDVKWYQRAESGACLFLRQCFLIRPSRSIDHSGLEGGRSDRHDPRFPVVDVPRLHACPCGT